MQIEARELFISLAMWLLHGAFTLFVILSSIWLCLALWYQQPFGNIFSRVIIAIWVLFALSLIGFYINGHIVSRRTDILLYGFVFACALLWYFSLEARQDRDWNPEVAKQLHYEKQGDMVTLHNVRNFNWRSNEDYDIH